MEKTKLSLIHKAVLWIVLVFSGSSIAYAVFRLATESPVPLSIYRNIMMIVFNAVFVYVCVMALKTGSWDIRKYPNAITGVVWVFVVSLVTVLMLQTGGSNTVESIRAVLFGMVFFLTGIAMLLNNIVAKNSLKTMEELEDIQHSLDVLSEKILNGKN